MKDLSVGLYYSGPCSVQTLLNWCLIHPSEVDDVDPYVLMKRSQSAVRTKYSKYQS